MQVDHWRGIELRHLAALQAIAEEGSFHAAANRLGYSQSAISQQIATLERIIGATLFMRPGGPRKVSLTDAGKLVLHHADAIMARLQAAQADAASFATSGLDRLRVGTFQSVSEKVMPGLMSRFREAHPGVETSLIESESDEELLHHIEYGDLDLAFALLPLPDGPFGFTALLHDPWMLLVPADSPLANRPEPVSLHEVANLPLIGARLHRCRMHMDEHFHAYGLEPRYVLRSDENGTVHGLVAAGMGVGIVPQLAVDPRDERVVALQLESSPSPRVIALAWHQDRQQQPVAEAFIGLTREFCAELGSQPATWQPDDTRRALLSDP